MKSLHVQFLTVLLVACFSVSHAAPAPEIEKAPIPSGPLVAKMPNPSAWKLSYTYDSENGDSATGKAAPSPAGPGGVLLQEVVRRITVSYDGDSWVAVTEDVKGRRLEQCSIGRQNYLVDSKYPERSVGAPVDSDGNLLFGLRDFSDGVFPDLDWITASTYLGVQKSDGVDFLVFGKEDGSRAWVNAKTRFPALVKTPPCTVTYERLPNPAGHLPIPKAVQEFVDSMNAIREILSRPRHPGS